MGVRLGVTLTLGVTVFVLVFVAEGVMEAVPELEGVFDGDGDWEGVSEEDVEGVMLGVTEAEGVREEELEGGNGRRTPAMPVLFAAQALRPFLIDEGAVVIKSPQHLTSRNLVAPQKRELPFEVMNENWSVGGSADDDANGRPRQTTWKSTCIPQNRVMTLSVKERARSLNFSVPSK